MWEPLDLVLFLLPFLTMALASFHCGTRQSIHEHENNYISWTKIASVWVKGSSIAGISRSFGVVVKSWNNYSEFKERAKIRKIAQIIRVLSAMKSYGDIVELTAQL